jgi:transposase
MSGQYQDYGELMTCPEMAEMFKVSPTTVRDWFRKGEFPFGKLQLKVDYFMSGREIRIVKDRICQLAGILPKSNQKEVFR